MLRALSQISLLAALLLGYNVTMASSQQQLDTLLKMQDAPEGVVIEIVAGRHNLQRALTQGQDYIKQLRKRFPDLPVAIVSHGSEQFDLLKDEKSQVPQLHAQVQSLVKQDNIPVHVCGTHASWRLKDETDFPDYVNVAEAGPAQINDYRALGYELLVIRKADLQGTE